MTNIKPSTDFFIRLRLIESAKVKPRDLIMLYAIRGTPGMMGQELSKKLGYETRSALQSGLHRLIDLGLIEDRRLTRDQQTPNNLHITDAGKALLDQIVPT